MKDLCVLVERDPYRECFCTVKSKFSKFIKMLFCLCLKPDLNELFFFFFGCQQYIQVLDLGVKFFFVYKNVVNL